MPTPRRGLPRAPVPSKKIASVIAAVLTFQLAYVFFFVFPGHDPKPNGLRLGVVGTAGQVAVARTQVDDVLPGAELRPYASRATAIHAIMHRHAYGAVVFRGGREQVLTASAASFTVSSSLRLLATQARVPQADVVPLSSGDPRGAVISLMVIPLIVTGLLGSTYAIKFLGLAPLHHRLLYIGVVAIVGGFAVATLVGPVLGTLPGVVPLLACALALAIFGLLTVGGGLIRLLGPADLAIGFAIFLMIGNPASGVSSAPNLVPSPWAQIGPLLTPGALASALRSIAYFHGAGIALPTIVLTAIALVGIALELLADRRLRQKAQAAGRELQAMPLSEPVHVAR